MLCSTCARCNAKNPNQYESASHSCQPVVPGSRFNLIYKSSNATLFQEAGSASVAGKLAAGYTREPHQNVQDTIDVPICNCMDTLHFLSDGGDISAPFCSWR